MQNLTPRQIFLSSLAQTTHFPLLLEIERAEGVFMYTPDGAKVLDLISGIGVSNVGHCNPLVVDAIKAQLDKYMHLMVYGEIVSSAQTTFAATVLATLPPAIDNIYIVNSGSEAAEGAIKLSRRYTGKHRILSCHNAYHGSTTGALAIGGSESLKTAYRPLLPGVGFIRFGNAEDLALITEDVAAVIIETIQGEAGIRLATSVYFKELRARCSATGTLLIADEIQCGAGRTGTFWAFDGFCFAPDIVLSAKGIGGGMPIGFFATSKTIMDCFAHNPMLGHITTFGGHPVSCVAATATVNYILDANLGYNAMAMEGVVRRKAAKWRGVKDVRGKGLMLAVAFESFDILKPIIDQSLANHVLTDWFLFCDNAMRIAPPLNIAQSDLEDGLDIIEEAINKVLA